MCPQQKTLPEQKTGLAVQVPRRKAETALEFLRRTKLLDRGLHFKRRDGTLVLPLVRGLNPAELAQLQRLLGDVTLGEDEFETGGKSQRKLEDVLLGQVPPDLVSFLPRSFDVVGDIAVLDLNPDIVPYEKIVASAIMRIHPKVRGVFAKAGAVSGNERLRPLRHISGEENTETTHREFGCAFRVDLSKAFFSPRLSTEHQRVAEKVGDGECVVDMFAGVGPFSILIAKKLEDVEVNAIDSNLEAIRLLRENARLNRVETKIKVWPGDAADVVRECLVGKATRMIMNHPSAAEGFLEAACSALKQEGGIVHYYTFAEGEDCEETAREEFVRGIKRSGSTARDILETRKVREVAPMRWHVVVDAKVGRGR